MGFVSVANDAGLATITLSRGRVNALNEPMVEEIDKWFADIEPDAAIKGVVLRGAGSFFSFGFDVPELLGYSKDEFVRFLRKFNSLCAKIYLYPKPVIAALNGHAVAGGCLLALTCDYRIMVKGKARIGLNEITFGAPMFSGGVEMLTSLVGNRNGERVLLLGAMYSAEKAQAMGLVDEAADDAGIAERVKEISHQFCQKDPEPFRIVKRLIRKPVAEKMSQGGENSIRDFADIWYSENTWRKLQEIKIHG
ncbi:MAG: enoyl-CoA hydratase/isomerase family protein [Syntrophobacteraceae bacterium]|nr:enoyl-CoA hydratase/isomerase family protein [Syntrophobacteraceae bacterium]